MTIESGLIKRLPELLDGLRADGFSLGAGEYVAAHRLLLKLAASGRFPKDPNRLRTLLGPLLCSSPAEQRLFAVRFSIWASESGEFETAQVAAPTEALKEIKTIRRWGRWFSLKYWSAAIASIAFLFLLWRFRPGVEVAGWASQLTGLVIVLILLRDLFFRFAAGRSLRRGPGKGKFGRAHFPVTPQTVELFPETALQALSLAMRRPEQSSAETLDVSATIRNTIQNGRRFTPIYARRFRTPEYIALVDRRTYRDHAAEWIQELISELNLREAPVETFNFDRDPQICFFTTGARSPVELHIPARRHPDFRLLVFGNPDKYSEESAKSLLAWKNRAFFDIFPRRFSSRVNAAVFTADEAGLMAAANHFNHEKPSSPFMQSVVEQLPLYDVADSTAFHWRESPAEKDVEALIKVLFDMTDANGRRWLCACAVYPELRWGVTLHLGATLLGNNGRPLFSRKRLLYIARLPWFRHGAMPDWLRRRLIADDTFRGRPAKQARRSLFLLLKGIHMAGPLSMEASVHMDSFITRVMRAMARKHQTPGSPLTDAVFMEFMVDPLSVKIARETARFIRKALRRETAEDERIKSPEPPKRKSKELVFTIGNEQIPLKLVYIPPGEFMMGSPEDELGRYDDESPRHKVAIEKGFYMQTTPVTQGQWTALMGNNPSRFKNAGPDAPVESVSWDDAKKFITRLNELTGKNFRLPTEAEWEYACRAGTTTALYNGPIEILGENNAPALDAIAWYGGNSGVDYEGAYDSSGWNEKQYDHKRAGTHPVGKKQPNGWKLFDMLGNVWEWVEDDWHGNYNGAPSNGAAWIDNPRVASRVYRGGSWDDNARYCRSAYRGHRVASSRFAFLGFRLALS